VGGRRRGREEGGLRALDLDGRIDSDTCVFSGMLGACV
jgi:hypothetical protein